MKAVLRVHTVERERKKKPYKKQLEKDEYLLSFQSEAKKTYRKSWMGILFSLTLFTLFQKVSNYRQFLPCGYTSGLYQSNLSKLKHPLNNKQATLQHN